MFKRITALFFTVLFTCLIFSSCSKRGLDKELYYPIYDDPVSFDPQIASDNASKILVYNCFEGLVRYNKEGKIIPGVAKSWSVSNDKRCYTFKLRTDTKWYMSSYAKELLGKKDAENFDYHVTAQDFVYGLRRAFDPAMGSVTDGRLYAIKGAYEVAASEKPVEELGVTAIDKYTLKIELTEPGDDFLSALTQTAAMPCREEFFLATKGKYGLDAETIIYNGPFYLYYWNTGVNLTLYRNENYHGEEPVYPKAVYLYRNDDLSTRVTKLDNGTYDACPLSVSQKNQLKDDKITFLNFNSSTWAFCFNCESELSYNYDVRAAICHATNLKDIELPDDVTGFSDGIVPDVCFAGGENYRTSAGKINRLSYSKKAVTEHLKNACNSLGIKFMDIRVICYEKFENTAKMIAQSWQKNLGVTVNFTIEPLNMTELNKRVTSGDYDIALTKITSDTQNAVSFLNKFSSNSGKSLFNFKSDNFNSLILQANSVTDKDIIVSNCKKAEKMLITKAVIYPLFSEDEYLGMAKNVSDIFCVEAGAVPIFLNGVKK